MGVDGTTPTKSNGDYIPYIFGGDDGDVGFRYVHNIGSGKENWASVRGIINSIGTCLKSDADIKMNGHEIYWNNVGTNGFRSGTDSAALATLNNLDIKSHYGVSFSCTCPGSVYNGSVTIDTRTGTLKTLGKIYSRNGYTVPVASLSGTTLTITI